MAVTGPNGAGKSTLLRIIAGLCWHLQRARSVSKVAQPGSRGPGAASHYPRPSQCHEAGFDPPREFSFLAVIRRERQWRGKDFHPRKRSSGSGLAKSAICRSAISPPGQKRRASIARLLVSDRPLWLLDEPTAGLDRASDMQFSGLMRGHLSNGGIIVAATHLPLGLEGPKN